MTGRLVGALVALVVLLTVAVSGSGSADAPAKKAKKCKGSVSLPPPFQGSVAKKIRVRNFSCANGKAVIRDPVGKGFDCPTGGPGAHGGTVKRCYKGHKQVKFLIV